jgi:hypothetical protein
MSDMEDMMFESAAWLRTILMEEAGLSEQDATRRVLDMMANGKITGFEVCWAEWAMEAQIKREEKEAADQERQGEGIAVVWDDGDCRPSQVTDDYWVYARREVGDYPPYNTARGGKWLLFVPKEHIDQAWATIKQATEEGRLGDSAKVATARPNPHATNPQSKVICVYTYDGDDRDDVGRVLAELRSLGFRGRLFWKADAATRSGLYSGAGRRVSRYSSDDFE